VSKDKDKTREAAEEFAAQNPVLSPEQQVAVDLVVSGMKGELKESERKYKRACKRIEEVELQLETVLQTKKHEKPLIIHPGRHKVDEGVAVYSTSDWHYAENVEPDKVSGLNEYNPDIATKRLHNLARRAVRLVDKERSAAKIESLVFHVGGDLMTGFIHEDHIESNYLHPIPEAREIKKRLKETINFFLEKGRFTKLCVICNFGNHGRTTARRRTNVAAENNYEWGVYHDVAEYYLEQKEKRIQFQVAQGIHTTMDILGHQIRFMHGDDISYRGGILGVGVPVGKAVMRMDRARPCVYTVMGHFHNQTYLPGTCINGSVCGYSTYAEYIHASHEVPMQSLFVVSADWGPVCFNQVFAE
jgi:hypothetical protein